MPTVANFNFVHFAIRNSTSSFLSVRLFWFRAYHLPLNRIICFLRFFACCWMMSCGFFFLWISRQKVSATRPASPFGSPHPSSLSRMMTSATTSSEHSKNSFVVICPSVNPPIRRILIVFHCFCFRFECHLSVNLKSHSQLPDLRAVGFSVSVEIPHGNNGIISGIYTYILNHYVYKHDGMFLLPILSFVRHAC